MCWEYDREYRQQRVEEARKELQKAEERMKQKPKPSAPAEAPAPGEREPVPA